MKKIIKLLLFAISFATSILSAQVVGTISNVSMNGIAIGAGQPIDLGTNNQVNVKYFVSFTKPNSLDLGSISTYGDIFKNGVLSVNGQTKTTTWGLNSPETSGWYEHIIYASDVDFGNFNYLQAVLQSNGIGGRWHSNTIKIIKIPTYTSITQNPPLITCGSTEVITFKLNSNDPSNASTFNWSYGTSWLYNGNFGGIRLVPVNYPLSNVSVVPSIHGATRGSYSKTPDLAPYTTTSTIQGSKNLCVGESSTYTLTNSASFTTVTWGLTNGTSVASISNATNSSVTVNGLNEGPFYLYAVVTNQCGQLTRVEKRINIGAPEVTNPGINGGANAVSLGSSSSFSVTPVMDATHYRWTIGNAGFSDCGCTTDANGLFICPSGVTFAKFTANGSTNFYTTSSSVNVSWGNCSADYVVNCWAVNSCGGQAVGFKSVKVGRGSGGSGGGSGGGSDPCVSSLRLFPNPVSDGELSIVAPPNDPCGIILPDAPLRTMENANLSESEIKIYDLFGNQVYNGKYTGTETKINFNLKKGHYVLNVLTSNGKIKRQVFIVK